MTPYEEPTSTSKAWMLDQTRGIILPDHLVGHRPRVANVQTISDFYRSDPLALDRFLLPETNRVHPPYAHQRIILNEIWKRKFLWIQVMRGGGKTYSVARAVLDYCLAHDNTPVILTAPSFRQSLMMFDEIVKIIEREKKNENANFKIASEVLGDIKRNTMESVIRFRNGSLVKAVPLGDGSKVRGLRGGILVLDEAYQMTKELYESHLAPFTGVKQGGRDSKIIMTTTSWYQDCFAYQRLMQIASEVRAGNPLYSILDFTLEDLVEEKFPLDPDVWKDAQRHGNPTTYLMTYYNIWPASGVRWYEQKVIDDALSTAHGVPVYTKRPKGDESSHVGVVDLAASEKGDSTVLLVARWSAKEDRFEYVYGTKRKGISSQERAWEVHKINQAFKLDYIVYDRHGAIGVDLRTDLSKSRLMVDGRVEEVVPLVHHDDYHLRGERKLIPVQPKDTIVQRSLMGPKDGNTIQGEDGLTNLLHTKCRELLWNGKIVGPSIVGGDPTEEGENTDYSGSSQEARDTVTEAFQQLANVGLAKDKNGQQMTTKSGQLVFKSKAGTHDDGAMCIVYAVVALLRYLGETQDNSRSRSVTAPMRIGSATGDTTPHNVQKLTFS